MKRIIVSKKNIQEARNLVDGVYFPLKGFLTEKELESVLEESRLPEGEIWSMPIVLDISEKEKEEIEKEKELEISDEEGQNIFILKNIQIFSFDKENFSQKLFGTTDLTHPGVQNVEKMKPWLFGGEIFLKEKNVDDESYLTPSKVRDIFKKNGWNSVVAFQTRNAPHLSHEYLQRCGLKEVDGLFIQPIIGEKKEGDFKDEHVMGAYQILFEKYFPKDKAMLGTLKTFMRYAGPKEALFHALVRRNFGCTHMIIGRDHAGVGNFYGAYDAQNIFDTFPESQLGIRILKYDNAVHCKKCKRVVFDSVCRHEKQDKIFLSGTQLRKKLLNNEEIPEEFMRREIVEYLIDNKDNLFVK